jgi:hypothetical protein
VLLTCVEDIGEIQLAHPQDITDKRLHVDEGDILANLPYHPACGMWFDHHLLTESNEKPPAGFAGRHELAPSAARVIYDHYIADHPELERFQRLLDETDRLDSAQLSADDVLSPKGYVLLGFTLDPRSGLGSWESYFHSLVDLLKTRPIEEVLARPEVADRVERMRAQDEAFRRVTREHSRLEGNVVVTDFRSLEQPPVGNRFLVYTLYPEANISLRVHRAPGPAHIAVAVGHSIFNRTSNTNVGELMARHNGGGHKGAGTCLLPADDADRLVDELIQIMQRDG